MLIKKLFSAFIIISVCAVSNNFADIGYTFTGGPDNYTQTFTDVGFKVSRSANLNIGFGQYGSSGTGITKNNTVALNLDMGRHFNSGLSINNSAESEGYKFYGWGTSFSFHKGNNRLAWDLSLQLNRTMHSSYVGLSRVDWVSLSQSSFEPSLAFTFNERLVLRVGFASYSYKPDISAVLSKTNSFFLRNINLGGVVSLAEGFPSKYYDLGVSYLLTDDLKLGAGWSTIYFLSGLPNQDSTNFSVTYGLLSWLELSAGCNIVSSKDLYNSLGMHLLF